MAPAYGDTLGEGWPYHRTLTFTQAASDAPGDNLAWAQFYANGAQKADGSDFRVTTPEGVIVPLRIMQISGDDDLVRIAFVTHGNGPYYVWWGNPKADKPGPVADIRRGVFCEIFKHPGGDTGSMERIRGLFERAKIVEGSVFVPEIFLGYNPLGSELDAMFRYRTQLRIDKDGSYDFAFAVDDAGYVAIDGKPILHANYKMPQDARNHKVVDLKAGWHDLEVTQVNTGGPTSVSLAWRQGNGRYETIPAKLYAPVVEAGAGPLEKAGQSYCADFAVRPLAEIFSAPDNYLQRYQFEVDTAPAGATLHWDFGDGQTAGNESRPTHEYLTPGIYPVTLSVQSHGLQFKGTFRVRVQDRMYSRFPYPPKDTYPTVAAVLDGYDRSKLSAEQRFRGMLFFKDQNAPDHVMAWGKSWEEAADTLGADVLWQQTQDLSGLCASHGDFKLAAQVYLLAANKPVAMDTRLNCLRMYAIETCDYGGDPGDALKRVDSWRQEIDTHDENQMHTLLAAEAYCAVAQGDGATAAKDIKDAGTRRQLSYADMEIHQGVLARNVETYIRTADFDTAARLLDQWETDIPGAIVEGFTRLLKVKLLVAEGRPAAAALVAQQLVRANPTSFYAAELLYRASQALKTAGKPEEAQTVLNMLKDKYPESPYARGDAVKAE